MTHTMPSARTIGKRYVEDYVSGDQFRDWWEKELFDGEKLSRQGKAAPGLETDVEAVAASAVRRAGAADVPVVADGIPKGPVVGHVLHASWAAPVYARTSPAMSDFRMWSTEDWIRHYAASPASSPGLVNARSLAEAGRIAYPSVIVDEKNRVEAKFKALLADVQACKSMSPNEKMNFQAEYNAWRRLYCDDGSGNCATAPEPSFFTFGLGGKLDDIEKWEKRIFDWQQSIASRCTLSMPVVRPVPTAETDIPFLRPFTSDDPAYRKDAAKMMKYGAVAIGIVALAYMFGPAARSAGARLAPKKEAD